MGFLTPILLMALFATVVAGVLAWVNKALTIEGEARVRIANNGHSMVFPLTTNLMEGLGERGYALMAQCAGGGTCATCRVRVVEGIDEPNAAMLGPISPKLQKEGWILSCQTSLMADCEIELFDALVTAWPDEIESDDGEEAAPAEVLPENVAALRNTMPGFDCGACGYDTCSAYAQAIVDGQAGTEACLPGGAPVLSNLQKAAAAQGVVSLSPMAQDIRKVLPGFDCDDCGYPTCSEFASAVAEGNAPNDGCTPGGESVLVKISELKGN